MVTATEETSWKESINLNGCNIAFKLDTGAEVTAISRRTFQKLHGTKLEKPSRLLHGPSQQDLKVVGQFSGNLSCKGRYTRQHIFVIDNLRTNLLGLPAITALNLVTRVQAITGGKLNVQQRFPRIFQGLGNLGQEYEIQLKPGAKPHSIYTPRRIPLPLLTKVQQELNRMEALGVITKIDKSTPWCAGMVKLQSKSKSAEASCSEARASRDVLEAEHMKVTNELSVALSELAAQKSV